MGTFLANWHDEDKNRNIHFSVAYAAVGGEIEIRDIVPNQVAIVCPETNTCLKTMNVYTAKGRRLLADQIRASSRLQELQREIAERRLAPTNS